MSRSDAGQVGLLEVARRQQGPIEVALLWDAESSGATVVVWNWSTGACLRLLAEPQQAKYAFTHPYAYAAAQGISQRDVLRAA